MKQIYLTPRGAFRAPPRSDTLFGLLAHAVRVVYGRASVERFLAPVFESPAQAPLTLTSAFPWIETERGKLHFFPAPLSGGGAVQANGSDRAPSGAGGFVEDADFLSWVAGHKPAIDRSPVADGLLVVDRDRDGSRCSLTRGGFFFLADGPAEHYLEAALSYLERAGFGGGASHGLSQFDVSMTEAEFVRRAHPGERGVLLSLWHPTAEERELLVREARTDPSLAWRIERRSGHGGGALTRQPVEEAGRTSSPNQGASRKPALAMITEGSIVVHGPARTCGQAPIVARGRDAAGEFPIVHGGFGFLVPLLGRGSEAAA